MNMDQMLKQLNTQSKCSKCGVPNKCAIEQGKSASACWCMGMPATELKAEGPCLCKTCLTNYINQSK